MYECFSFRITTKIKILLTLIVSVFCCINGYTQEAQTNHTSHDTLFVTSDVNERRERIELIMPPLALKTNLLYDLAMVPNISIEVGLFKNLTAKLGYHNIWLRNKAHTWWYRTEAWELEFDYYMNDEDVPFKGHHAGVYWQLCTWDMTFKKRGYLAERWAWGLGLLYGYTMPIVKDFNIDFEVGVGYLGGKRHKYTPQDGHRVWNSTKPFHWIRPTKVEVTAQWVIDINEWRWIRR